MSRTKITRRSLLKGAGLGIGATVVGAIGTPVGAAEEDAVFGVIEQTVGASKTVFLLTPDGVSVVQFDDDSLFWKDQQTTFDAFAVGDEVSIDGDAVGDVVVGRTMKSILRIVEGEIETRDGNLLHLSTGVVEILPTTHSHGGGGKRVAELARLKAGDIVSVLGRVDSSTGHLIATKIGLL